MVRLFIGVMVPDGLKSDITALQGAMSRMPMRAKLVEPENLHVSLSFLGEVQEDRVGDVSRRLDLVCGNHRRFTVKVSDVMFIPNEEFTRVIALNCRSSGDEIGNLRKGIVNVVGGDSHPAHLTLARVREMVDRDFVLNNLRERELEKYFEVAEVSLVRSYMSRTGPAYQVLHRSRLQ